MRRVPTAFSGYGGADIVDRHPGPAPKGGVLYYAGEGGCVYSYDLAAGTQKQLAELNCQVDGLTFLHESLYLIAAYSFDSCDPKTGDWKGVASAKVGDFVTCLAGLDEKVYFGTRSGRVYSYAPATQKRKEVADTRYRIGHMAGLDGVLYFSDYGNNIHSYTPTKKRQRGIGRLEDLIKFAAKIGENLYFGVRNDIVSYDPVSKTFRSEYLAPIWNTVKCAVALDKTLYFGDYSGCIHAYDSVARHDNIVADVSDSVDCIAPYIAVRTSTGGGLSWSGGCVKPQSSHVAVNCMTTLHGVLYFGDNNGGLHSYNPATGKCRRMTKIAGSINHVIAVGK